MKHVALVVCLALSLPARAQPADAPCKAGDVALTPDAAVAAAKRLAAAEAKVDVYEKRPPLPVWAVVLLVAAGAAVGVGGTVVIYEASRPRP